MVRIWSKFCLKLNPSQKDSGEIADLQNDELLVLHRLLPEQRFTKPPPRFTEASLIKALEGHGIGRPSTFSSLISKIQERGYVQKADVEGQKVLCMDYRLVGDELEEIETERIFGGERNKLVIQPTGVLVLEFLLKNFDPLFKYEYTKKMETSLDRIAKGDKVWHTLCLECHSGINLLSEKIAKDHRESICLLYTSPSPRD